MVNSQKTKSKHKRVSMKKKSKILKKVKLHCEKKAKEARKIVHYKAKPKERDAEVLEDAQVAAMEARRAKAIENYEQNQAAKRERAAAKRKMGSAAMQVTLNLRSLRTMPPGRLLSSIKLRNRRVTGLVPKSILEGNFIRSS